MERGAGYDSGVLCGAASLLRLNQRLRGMQNLYAHAPERGRVSRSLSPLLPALPCGGHLEHENSKFVWVAVADAHGSTLQRGRSIEWLYEWL